MRKIKLLYLSCHSIAEYDEIKLFDEIGIEVYSHGAYSSPHNPGDPKRPSLNTPYDPSFEKACKKIDKEHLTKEFVKNFDIIFFHWMPKWVAANWEVIKDKIVILRTNGQSSENDENWMAPYRKEGLKIVRYADIEKTIPGYIGHDAIIRFYKDPEEFKGWNGRNRQVITVVQNMKRRGAFCNYDAFYSATIGFPRKLFGPDNEDSGELWGGLLSYEDLKKAYRDNAVYFYTGTKPACYTLNFIEAWMTGIPIVAIGPKLGNPRFLENQYTYEIPFLGRNGKHYLMSDDVGELSQFVFELLNRANVAARLSKNGRERAIEIFGKDKIKKQWEEFFKNL